MLVDLSFMEIRDCDQPEFSCSYRTEQAGSRMISSSAACLYARYILQNPKL